MKNSPKIKIVLAIALLCLFSRAGIARAEIPVNVSLRLIDSKTAELKIVYLDIDYNSELLVLWNKQNGGFPESNRELIKAVGEDGSERLVYEYHTSLNFSEDDAIGVLVPRAGDRIITLHYKLINGFSESGLSLFSFAILTGGPYPNKVNFSIEWPDGYELVSDSDKTLSKPNGNKKTFSVFEDKSVKLNLIEFFTIFHKKGSDYKLETYKGYTFANKVSPNMRQIIDSIDFLPAMLEKVFHLTLPKNIVVLSTKIPDEKNKINAEGIAIIPNTIILDERIETNSIPEGVSILVHELTHILVNSKIFSGEGFMAPWFSEGLAVFAQEYAADTSFKKDDWDGIYGNLALSKSTVAELEKEYKYPFDMYFEIDTEERPIRRTYSHAGLVMYSLYNSNPGIFPSIINSLANETPAKIEDFLVASSSRWVCENCDSEKIIRTIENFTRQKKDDWLYPYRTNLSQIPSNLILSVDQKKALEVKAKDLRQLFSTSTSVSTTSVSTKKADSITASQATSTSQSSKIKPIATSTISESKKKVIPVTIEKQHPSETIPAKINKSPVDESSVNKSPVKKTFWKKIGEFIMQIFR